MDNEKLRISLGEVYSDAVDEKLKSQDAFSRTQEHYAQQMQSPAATEYGHGSLLYNAIFYMSVFGFFGGLFGWMGGEFVLQTIHNDLEEFIEFKSEEAQLAEKVDMGEISEEEADRQYEALCQKYAGNRYVSVDTDETLNDRQKEATLTPYLAGDLVKQAIKYMIMFGIVGAAIAFFLSIAEPVITQNWRAVAINGSVALLLGAFGGVVVSLFINKIYRALGGGSADGPVVQQMFARAVGWAIFGAFLAIAPGIVMGSQKRFKIGLAGGFIGGLVGGLLFDPITAAGYSDVLSRAVAITTIGFAAALGTGLIETAAKTGWLLVTHGLIAGKQFILYRSPTNIGSSPQCEIYLFKDTEVAPMHASISQVPGGYELQDQGSPTGTFLNGQAVQRQRLKSGDQIQVGSTVFEFQVKERHS